MVVVPSITFAVTELRKIVAARYYEERLLFLLLFLARPELRLVYLTSTKIDPDIVDYYLRFLPDPADARQRLHLVDLADSGDEPLSEKLLHRAEVLDELRSLAVDPRGSTLLTFNVTPLEHAIAARLGLAVDGPATELAWTGSKSGAHKIAARAGVAHPVGREDLFDSNQLASAIEAIRASRPDTEAVVVKLNNGFSGQGNAVLPLAGLADPLSASKTVFCSASESWPSFLAKIRAEGAIAEELLRAPGLVSPSAQLRITARGLVELLSTHDQILGGRENQVYLGCRYPAAVGYRSAIEAEALKVGVVLAAEGVIGWFGIDFLVDGDKVYLSEINLRMGGTTHPYWMARLVTGGEPKAYVATDNIKLPGLLGRTPADVIAAVDDAGLAFDRKRGLGVTLHLLGPLPEAGKMGATCIADNADEAEILYQALIRVLS
ncbi:MAG: peptide ligase PGM1-related protein [Acidimicrobiales bacterium]